MKKAVKKAIAARAARPAPVSSRGAKSSHAPPKRARPIHTGFEVRVESPLTAML